MTIAPLQHFGIGDIIFCQTLANEWIAAGHKVVWGVLPEWIEGLKRAYPNVQWVDYKTLPIDYNRREEYDMKGYRVIPLRWSVELCDAEYKDCMKTKYALFGKDWQTWRDGAKWLRDGLRELELCKLRGKKGEYNLIHQDFGSDQKFNRKIIVNNGLPNIYVETIPGFSLFDWEPIYENATTIHAVSSSNIYLMEMLELKAEEIHLYKRDRVVNGIPCSEPHSHYDYLLKSHKYIYE